MTGSLRRVARAVRFGEWWGFKMGPVLALALAEALVDAVPPAEAALAVGLVALSGAAMAAYGHVLNDAADVAADAAAGRPNALAAWPRPARGATALALLAGSFAVWLVHPVSALALGVLAVEAAVLAAYALPPARLKARGGLGVAADAAYAHVLPVWFVLAVFSDGGPPTAWDGAWVAALSVWAAAMGVHGILLHQLWDIGDDRRAGTPTFAVRRGAEAARRWGRRAAGVEVAAAVSVVVVLGAQRPLVAGGLAAVALVSGLGKRRGWGPPSFDPMPVRPGSHVPLALAYAAWPGLCVGAGLVAADPWHAPLVVAYGALFIRPIVSALRQWDPRRRRGAGADADNKRATGATIRGTSSPPP